MIKKNNSLRNFIWIVAGIMILAGFAWATTITIGDNNGVVVGDSKLNKVYDAVVCKGTSVADDNTKNATCDYVCKSTDTDCQQELQATLGTNCNNKRILWMPGNYTLYTKDQITNTAYLVSYCENFTLDAYGVILNINYTTTNGQAKGFEIEGSNTHINGLEIVGNKINATLTYGLRIYGTPKNVFIKDTKVSNVKGFAYTIENSDYTSPTQNIHIENCEGFGLGTNDIIGGGSNSKDVFVSGCRLEQHLTNGDYKNAFDLVNLTNLKASGNIMYGGMLIGNEEGGSRNIIFSNNIVLPAINDTPLTIVDFGIFEGNTSNIVISGNIVSNNLTMLGNNYSATNNIYGQFSKDSIGNSLGIEVLEPLRNLHVRESVGSTTGATIVSRFESTNSGNTNTGHGVGIEFSGKNPVSNFNGGLLFDMAVISTQWLNNGAGQNGKTAMTIYLRNTTNPSSDSVIPGLSIYPNTYVKMYANSTTITCDTSTAGSFYYDGNVNKHYGCNSTDWNALY